MNFQKLFKNITFQTLLAAIISFSIASILISFNLKEQTLNSGFYDFIIIIKVIFLKSLKMLIGPVVFFSIIGGLINLGDKDKLKSTGKIAFTYYLSTTFIAISIGLFIVLFVHPWENYKPFVSRNSNHIEKSQIKNSIETKFKVRKVSEKADSIPNILKKFINSCLVNPFSALANLNILGIVFNAFLFGLAIIVLGKVNSNIIQLVSELNSLINLILNWIIKLSPFGVFAIIFEFKLGLNSNIFAVVFSFALVVVLGTLVHGIIVLPLIAYFFGSVSPKDLIRKISKPLLVAFSTSSSSATLPISLETCDNEFKINRGVSGFMLPLGATMNMDGTALFEGIAAVFLAYMYGIDLTGISIFSIFLMAMISSIGAPGMPSGSMAGMQIVLLSIGVPLEGIAILLLVEKPLDTIRTAVNVEGDIVGAIVSQKRIFNKV